MKKFLIPLLCLFPMSAFALTPVSDVTITSENTSIAFDQDGDALTIGYDGLTFSTSNTVDFGIGSNSFIPLNMVANGLPGKAVMASFQKDPQI